MLTYLIIVNIISSILFYIDKHNAVNGRFRVNESLMHFIELLGGVFMIFLLMYILRHKNRKLDYFLVTYAILVFWIFIIVMN